MEETKNEDLNQEGQDVNPEMETHSTETPAADASEKVEASTNEALVTETKETQAKEEVAEEATNEIYHYYGHASNCIISLFTAMESFINHLIPDSEKFERVLKNRTEIYSKEQIQEHINFNDKLKTVLPYFFEGKNFFQKSTPANQLLTSLKELRDDIIHTKSEKNFEKQEQLFARVLKFKYDKAIEAVGTFMNFYKPDYLMECDCGIDY